MNHESSAVEDRLRDAVIALADPIQPDVNAWSQICRRTERQPRPRRTRAWKVALVGFATAAIAVAVPVILVNQDRQRPGPRELAEAPPTTQWERTFAAQPVPSFQRTLAVDASTVFSSDGFNEPGVVRALDRATGATRWSYTFPSPAFPQGAADGVLVVGEQYNTITGLDTETGAVRWTVDLPSEGLAGYGAVVSAIRPGTAVVGLSANAEGDVRAPVALALDPTTGTIRWRTALTNGTDLTFAQPVIADNAVVFLSTLSHPGSAAGNTAHAVNLADGSIRWTLQLGGTQGFGSASPIASPGAVQVPSQGEIVTVASDDGSIRWRAPITGPVAIATAGDHIAALDAGSVVVLDLSNGHEISRTSTTIADAQLITTPNDGRTAVIIGQSGAEAIDLDKQTALWSLKWPAPLATIPLESGGQLLAATQNGRVIAYALPNL